MKNNEKEIRNDKLLKGHQSSSFQEFQGNLEKRRWVILLMFCLYTFTNAANWLTYSSIVDASKEYYEKETSDIIWFGNTYFITYIILSYFGSWMVYRYFKLSMIVGTLTGALGCWIRFLGKKNYGLAMFGAEFNALSQIWVLETPMVISEIWFPKKEKFIAISLAIFSNFLGNGISYIFSAAIVGDDYNNLPLLLFISAIVTTIPFLLCLICIKEKPDNPANITSTLQKEDFLNSLKSLLKNKRYIFSVLCLSFCLGHIWTIDSLIDEILAPYKLSTIYVGVCGLIMILVGMIGGLIASGVLELIEDSRLYIDKLIKILMAVSMIALIILAIFIKSNLYLAVVFLSVIGFGLLAVTPFVCESLVETAFPVQESLSTNTLFLVANIIGEIETLIVTPDSVANYRMMILAIFFIAPFLYSTFFFKTEYKRSNLAIGKSSFKEKAYDDYTHNSEVK